jgi:hypothetical protein
MHVQLNFSIKVTIFTDTNVWFGLAQKFCARANINCMHYRTVTLEYVDLCTISAYKSQNLVLAQRALSQNRRKMYVQVIVTLR